MFLKPRSDYIRDAALFEVSVEACLAAVTSPMSHQFPQSIEAYFPKVISLNNLLQARDRHRHDISIFRLSRPGK